MRDEVYRRLLVGYRIVIQTLDVHELVLRPEATPKRSTWRASGHTGDPKDPYWLVTYGVPNFKVLVPDTAMLAVSPDMYSEASIILYEENEFHFSENPGGIILTPLATLVTHFLQDRPSEARQRIKSVTLNQPVCRINLSVSHTILQEKHRRSDAPFAERELPVVVPSPNNMEPLWHMLQETQIRTLSINLSDISRAAVLDRSGDVYALEDAWVLQLFELPTLEQFSITLICEEAHMVSSTATELRFNLVVLEEDEIDRSAEGLILLAKNISPPHIASKVTNVVKGERQVLLTGLSTASGAFDEESIEISRDHYFLSVNTRNPNARLYCSRHPVRSTLNSQRLRKVQTEVVRIEEHDEEENSVDTRKDIFFYQDISRSVIIDSEE